MFVNGFDKPDDFSDPMGLFVDKKSGEIFVADTGNSRICVFSPDGMPVMEYRTYNRNGVVPLGSPIDLVVDSGGNITYTDLLDGRVRTINFRGDFVSEIDLSKANLGSVSPGRIAIDADNNLFIADTTNNMVLVFQPTGRFSYKFGGVPANGGNIEELNAVWPSRESDRIYVTSKSGVAVIIYNYEGLYINSFGAHDSGEMNFSLPAGIIEGPGRIVLVADTLRSDVKVFDQNSDYILRTGGIGEGPLAMIYPVDLDIDKDGNVYVLEKGSRRVNVISFKEVASE